MNLTSVLFSLFLASSAMANNGLDQSLPNTIECTFANNSIKVTVNLDEHANGYGNQKGKAEVTGESDPSSPVVFPRVTASRISDYDGKISVIYPYRYPHTTQGASIPASLLLIYTTFDSDLNKPTYAELWPGSDRHEGSCRFSDQ
jgi:hypothetical protein